VSGASRVYLDHAASSPLVAEAAAAMAALDGVPGNPSSLHTSGRAARRVVEEARESLAADLGCHPMELVFTSGGTEADNLAIVGGWRARASERPGVLTSPVEHPAVLEAVDAARTEGAADHWLPVDTNGVAILERPLPASIGIASLQWVNNETGVIQDVAGFAELAASSGAWRHSDAVQALGHVPVSFSDAGLDAMSISAHKVGGPVGIGALVVRREVDLAPIGFGGGQERKLRSGTVPVALAAGFAAAVRAAVARLDHEAVRLRSLGDHLVAAAVAAVPEVTVNGADAVRSPAVVNLTFHGVRADDLLLLLDASGIDCSTGSACTAGVSRPSEVLLAMGRTEEDASASLRFSFGPGTTAADIDTVLAVLPDAVARARTAAHR